jgi:hypothetical protein
VSLTPDARAALRAAGCERVRSLAMEPGASGRLPGVGLVTIRRGAGGRVVAQVSDGGQRFDDRSTHATSAEALCGLLTAALATGPHRWQPWWIAFGEPQRAAIRQALRGLTSTAAQ